VVAVAVAPGLAVLLVSGLRLAVAVDRGELPERVGPDPPEPPGPLAACAPPASTVTIAAARIHPPMALASPMTGPSLAAFDSRIWRVTDGRQRGGHRQPHMILFCPASQRFMRDHSNVLTMLQAARSR
jgi:hypothetical protein